MPTQDIAALRGQLYANGFRPVAITAGAKFPWQKRWPELARQDPPHACVWIDERMPGTGLLCDGLRPVDVDLDDPLLAETMCRFVEATFGTAPYRFRHGSPRRLYLFRAAEGEPHKLYCVNEADKSRVEVLGHGNQFFSHGTHPELGESLRWTIAPEDIDRADLPQLTESQVVILLDFAAELIGATRATHRPKDKPEPKPPKEMHISMPTQSGPWPLADIEAALATIICPADYDAWFRISCATHHACAGSQAGYAAWKAWCSAGPSYSSAAADSLWQSLYDAPTYFSAGTLVHTAREHDPEWDRPSRAGLPQLSCFNRSISCL